MRPSPLSIGFLAVAIVTLPLSAASAQEFYHHHRYGLVGGVFGLAGAIVVGAVTIATAPIVILADALSGGRHGRYYQRDGGYDRRGSAYDYDGSNNYIDPHAAYGREYPYPPRRAYSYPPQDYAPSQDFNRERYQSYPPYEAYNARRRGYSSEPPGQYATRRDYHSPEDYPDGSAYGPPPNDEQSGDNYSGSPDQFGSGQDFGPPQRSNRGQPDNDYPPPEGE
jgi:hypothetical protein